MSVRSLSEQENNWTVVITEQQENLHVDTKAFVTKAHNLS